MMSSKVVKLIVFKLVFVLVLSAATAFAAEDPSYSIEADVGLGFNSNAYEAPLNSYFDPIDAVTINPDKKSGFFVPLRLNVNYGTPMNKGADLLLSYSFKGDIYPSSETKDASEYVHKLTGGVEFETTTGNGRSGTVYVGPYVKFRDKTYVDPDTGDPFTSSLTSTDISGKFSYTAFGLETEYSQEIGSFDIELGADIVYFNYEEQGVVTSYDKTEYKADANVSYRVSRDTRLSASYRYSLEDFDNRKPHELDGTLAPKGNTTEYRTHYISVTGKQRFGDQLRTYLTLGYSIRNDEHASYYDYTQGEVKVRAVYKVDESLKIRGKVKYRTRDYDNALAFNRLGQAGLERNFLDISLGGDYDPGNLFGLDENWSFWGDYAFHREDTTDLRYDFNSHIVMLGVKWEG